MWANTERGQEIMEELRSKTDELESIVKKSLKPNVDYMALDGGKFCLLKAGAEKLCDYYGFRVQYELVESSANHVTEQALYIIKAILIEWQTGQRIAEGLGLASSQETRYEEENAFNIANTILKMAKKRAMVDAVISAVGGSFLFTQDMEDFRRADNRVNGKEKNSSKWNANETGRQSGSAHRSSGYNNSSKNAYGEKTTGKSKGNSDEATVSQINYIEKLVSALRINRIQLCSLLEEKYGIEDYRSLSKQQASELINELKGSSSQAS